MIETICNNLTVRIRRKMPEIDDERAEVINYGLQLIVGEIPKTFMILAIAWILGVLELTILGLILMLPYRTFSGGVHLNTHIGCVIATSLFYIGNALLSKYIILEGSVKYIVIAIIGAFSTIMITLYAPADTESAPILRKKDRRLKKILSYISMIVSLIAAILIKDCIISNLLAFGILLQTITITRFIYTITGNKYGYEEYMKNTTLNN